LRAVEGRMMQGNFSSG